MNTLAKSAGKAPTRAACCIALRNLCDHAISRFGAAKSWQVAAIDIKELIGKATKKCRKATLFDNELGKCALDLDLVWITSDRAVIPLSNYKKVRTLGPLVQLQENLQRESQTAQRQLEPSCLQESDSASIKWTVIEPMQSTLLELIKPSSASKVVQHNTATRGLRTERSV